MRSLLREHGSGYGLRAVIGAVVFLSVIVAQLLMAVPSRADQSAAYRIGPGDRIKLRVTEWRAARGEVFEWDALSGEFVVNDGGALALPLLGDISANALTTNELAAAVSGRLQQKIGLAQRPTTSVEIASYRPFYILGSVNRPGDYPYRPGLTVLQAIGIAGGFYRTAELRLQREEIGSNGDLRVALLDRDSLQVRLARLQAEVSDKPTFDFPPELAGSRDPTTQLFLQQEKVIFDARLGALRSQLESLNQLKVLLAQEINSLRDKALVQGRQLELARREQELVSSLVNKGLTVNSRQLSLEQATAQMETQKLDLSVAMLRAQQELSKADRDAIDLRTKRKDLSATEMKEVQVKLDETKQKAATLSDLISDTGVEDRVGAEPVFTIVRSADGATSETTVSENTTVMPGDVVRVRVPVHARQQEGSNIRPMLGRSTKSAEAEPRTAIGPR